ncbi:hypothetical protein DRH13_00270 [Candidatus Woesebacteria bacterium]|nr:MAG: hypothetical protein DRH13_00270 [Candidatus Woesebacteria bacterium]
MGSAIPQTGIIQVGSPIDPILLPNNDQVVLFWPKLPAAVPPGTIVNQYQKMYSWIWFVGEAGDAGNPKRYGMAGQTFDVPGSASPCLRLETVSTNGQGFRNVSGTDLACYAFGIPEGGFLSNLVASNVPPQGNSLVNVQIF